MTFTTGDLSGVVIALVVLVVAAGAVSLIMMRSRRAGSSTLALNVTAGLAFVWLVLCTAGAVLLAFTTLSSGRVVADVPDIGWEGAATTDCDFAGSDGQPAIDCYGDIVNAPLSIRLLLLVGGLLLVACWASLGWAVRVAAVRALDGSPFAPAVARTFSATAVIVMVAGVLGEVLQQAGRTLAVRAVPGMEVPFEWSVPLWPFAVGIGCFALVAIFRNGARLEHETERLV